MASLDLLMAVCYSLSWAVASSGLILLNKYILSNLDFHYPLTLSRCVVRIAARVSNSSIPLLTPLHPASAWASPPWLRPSWCTG